MGTDSNDGILATRFFTKLVGAPRGRAFVLNYLQSMEESDEGAVFDLLVERVTDPEFRKMVRVHRDDEKRHAEIFRRAVERVVESGGPDAHPGPVEEQLHVVRRLDDVLGGLSAKFIAGEVGIMELYVLLQVLEERAVGHLPRIAVALRSVDVESAEDLERVLRDERRHVKYARAIARRYAPDDATYERELARVRAAEARVFAEQTNAFTRVVVERRLLDVSPIERLGWQALAFLGELAAA
jgi:rubrerythrin